MLLLVQSQSRERRRGAGGGKERGRERMREPKRAEERKSIPIQSESDKPEQCIVQDTLTIQSHIHVHVETLTDTLMHAHIMHTR